MDIVDRPQITCTHCCSPNVERRNASTWVCLDDGHTFNPLYITAGKWVDADRFLAFYEQAAGPVALLRGEARPLNYDGAARLAWITGHVYMHQTDGTTLLWVHKDCGCEEGPLDHRVSATF